MIGGAVMTSLMLPLSGDLFDSQPKLLSIILLICTAVDEPGSGPLEPKGDLSTQRRVLGRFGQFPNGLHSFPPLQVTLFEHFEASGETGSTSR